MKMKTLLTLLLFSLCANGFAQSGDQSTESLKATSEIRIRDPFILPYKQSGTYYMYAQTRNRDAQAPAGVEVYWSSDLKHWAGPEPVLELPEGFWEPKAFGLRKSTNTKANTTSLPPCILPAAWRMDLSTKVLRSLWRTRPKAHSNPSKIVPTSIRSG